MASKAYLRLLDKTVMTVNTFKPGPLASKPTIEAMTDFIMARLKNHRGYSRDYIKQLVIENERQPNTL